ncbi:UDP-N-acetylglucosamine 2-epimerase [Faecalispora anaeroviscerum]|uniref:UDP-N-acetylglucosamine 2-epimerase n=1 Tax=Faecalispora anaeroviscerum TaxID=2991836 RepID=UPI0024B9C33E|nr:UDP-N-acetylglucosamine 2-epimerase [Faecalispora anaeroviscerum]
MKRKLCVVTGTRSEYGLLCPLLKAIEKEPCFQLQLVVTGAHLSPEFGLTYREIEQDGFAVERKVELLVSSDTPVGIAKSIGLGVIGFAEAFDQLRPDLLVLLGDRYEILAAAQAALVAKIPIAHIGGGDTTEGAFDEAIRHSITKMAHLHFVTNEESARRVRQLGEDPARVYKVGSLGIDQIFNLPRMSRAELEQSLGVAFRERNLLITFHPVTLDSEPADRQLQELLHALEELGEDVGLIFTKPNADPQSRELIRLTEEFAAVHPNAAVYSSLGQFRYFSLIQQVDAVVGNSSSGLYEVPSFHKPTVNIGDRQKGRLLASSVLSCSPNKEEILRAIRKAMTMDCTTAVNPYGQGDSAKQIITILESVPDYRALLKKQFYLL